MGNGASAATAMAASVFKMQQSDELKNVIGALDMDTCSTLQKAINEKLGGDGSEMLEAAWLWEGYVVKSKLATVGVTCDCKGSQLLKGEAKFEKEEDKAKVDEFLEKTALKFMKQQVTAFRPFVGMPESAAKHCVYMWDHDLVVEFLQEDNICYRAMTGKKLLMDRSQFSDEEWESTEKRLGKKGKEFFVAMAKEMKEKVESDD